MRQIQLLAALAFFAVLPVSGQSSSFLQTVEAPDSASLDDLVRLAANVVPHPRQFAWQKNEFECFIHFGVNTFTRREWGDGFEDPIVFNPSALDAEQWVLTAKSAGMKNIILTVKHHDGFCLWPSRYTTHSVASSSWRNGNGNVVGDLAQACAKHGLKLGIYLSPADLYQIESESGLYGNTSQYSKRTIPRLVVGRPFKGNRSFEYVVDDYNEYFMNQLFELLTEYGPINQVWFDGAHPKRKGNQQYTYDQWYAMIRALATDAVISIMGPDVRWCGNEAGNTRPSEFSVVPLYERGLAGYNRHFDRTQPDIGSRAKLQGAKELMWYPAQVNTSIRHGWFYRDENQGVKSVAELLDIWYRAVGGNSTFLLNITPDRRGLIPEKDASRLRELGAILRLAFAVNYADGASVSGSSSLDNHQPEAALDGDEDTFWMPSEGRQTGDLVITLSKPARVNRVVVQECIHKVGQRIEAHALDAWQDGGWKEVAASTVVGYKRILRFDVVETDKFRLRITKSRLEPAVSSVGLFFEPPRDALPHRP